MMVMFQKVEEHAWGILFAILNYEYVNKPQKFHSFFHREMISATW
jgi:hypothetical protein